MFKNLKRLIADDSGAVTVDWVVLTAAIIGLGMTVLIPVALGSEDLSTAIADDIGQISIGYDSASN